MRLATWEVEVTVKTSEPLRRWEASLVDSLLSDHAATDWWKDEVTNGRHRVWGVWRSGAEFLPVQSRAVSDVMFGLFGDPDCVTLREQTWCGAYQHRFFGACEQWRRRPGADIEFIDGLRSAIEVADDFLNAVADAAGGEPRMLIAP